MKTQITHLIKTDIHLCRLTDQLKKLGFITNALRTENLPFILGILNIEETEEAADFYFKLIEKAASSDTLLDNDNATHIFKSLVCCNWKTRVVFSSDQRNP